jgi:4-amino-4-deoxy-L-arabinose transferase-like glycosyltransferase
MQSTESAFKSRWAAAGAAALSVYFLYFFRLGGTPLLDPDEPVYGQIAREMVRSGNWLTPHLAGRPWFDKPPLFYWASAAAMSVFGPTELAARLPSAISAVLLAALVFVLGRRFFGRAAGWAAAAVLATSLQSIILGRAAVTDMLFALTLMAPLAAFARWYEGTGPTTAWAALCGASLGLAILCKGPVAVVLLGLTAPVFLVWERQARRLLSLDAAVALICCLLVAGPWYGAMLALNRPEFVGQFIDQNNLQRFAKAEHASGASPLYFLPVLLVGLFPWTLFLPQAVSAGRRGWAGRLLIVWSAVVFVFFSASHTKLVTYIYPLYPAAALLIGAVLARSFLSAPLPVDAGRGATVLTSERRPPDAVGLPFGVVAATATLGVVLAVALIGLAASKYPAALSGAIVLSAALLVGSLWSLWSLRRRCSPVKAYAVMMTAAAAALGGLVGPQVGPMVSLRDLALWEDATHRPLVSYRLQTPGFLFYSGRELRDEKEPAQLAEQARAVPGLAVAMSRRALPQVEAATPDLQWRVIWRRGSRLVAEPAPRAPAANYTHNRAHGTDAVPSRAAAASGVPERLPVALLPLRVRPTANN